MITGTQRSVSSIKTPRWEPLNWTKKKLKKKTAYKAYVKAWAMQGGKKLKKAKVSKSLTKIPGKAFSDYTKLTQVTFPSSSKVTKIGDMAFDNCKSMKSITLPKKVTMICDESFH